MRKNLLPIFLMIILTLAVTEGLFQLNEKFRWVAPKTFEKYTSPPDPMPLPPSVDLSRLPGLRAFYDPALKKFNRGDIDGSKKYPVGLNQHGLQGHTSKLTVKNTEHVIYEVDYRFEKSGRRQVEVDHSKSRAFILALGDSFTFGEGVEQNRNYPYFLGGKLPDWHVYNMGWGGSAPNAILNNLQRDARRFYTDVRESKGIAIYTFIPSHMERITCPSTCLTPAEDYILPTARYDLGQDGRPVWRGRFDQRVALNQFYRLLNQSAFVRFFRLRFPAYGGRHYDLFVSLMDEIRTELSRDKTIQKFYFVIFPGMLRDHVAPLKKRLQAQQFTVLDYSNLDHRKLLRQAEIPLDFHPTAETHWLLSELLKQQIQKDFPEGP